jgi:hypothetical protein
MLQLIPAGLLSSRLLTTSDNEVLITGRKCGAFTNASELVILPQAETILYQTRIGVNAYTYATQCYNRTGNLPASECDKFALPRLPYTSDKNADCPFAKELCRTDMGNLVLDTGKLDSLSHLGINTGPRFSLQYRTHCAPLETEGFTDIVTDPVTGKRLRVYRYGTRKGSDRNQTYVYSMQADKEQAALDSIDNFVYGDYRIQ